MHHALSAWLAAAAQQHYALARRADTLARKGDSAAALVAETNRLHAASLSMISAALSPGPLPPLRRIALAWAVLVGGGGG